MLPSIAQPAQPSKRPRLLSDASMAAGGAAGWNNNLQHICTPSVTSPVRVLANRVASRCLLDKLKTSCNCSCVSACNAPVEHPHTSPASCMATSPPACCCPAAAAPAAAPAAAWSTAGSPAVRPESAERMAYCCCTARAAASSLPISPSRPATAHKGEQGRQLKAGTAAAGGKLSMLCCLVC